MAVCGNMMLEPGEQCDDGNIANVDGCSSTCRTEVVVTETEPNEWLPQAAAGGNRGNGFTVVQVNVTPPVTTTNQLNVWLRGDVNPSGDEDVFRVQLLATDDVLTARVEVTDINGGCPGDSYIVVRDVAGNILAQDDDDGQGLCSLVTHVSLPVGSPAFYVQVLGFGDASIVSGYAVHVEVAPCGDGLLSPVENCDGQPGCLSNCVFPAVCGDGMVQFPERCDDGAMPPVGGDGCSATCGGEPFYSEVDPNDDGSPSPGGGPLGNDYLDTAFVSLPLEDVVVTGSLSAPGDEDTYRVTNNTQGMMMVRFITFTSNFQTCGRDLRLVVRSGALADSFAEPDSTTCPSSPIYYLGTGDSLDATVMDKNDLGTAGTTYRLGVITSNCGNGILEPLEQCDGTPDCTFCRTIGTCGDLVVGPTETCDAVDGVAGDGCSRRCQVENPSPEIEPNDDGSVAVGQSDFALVATTGPWWGDMVFTGALNPAGDEDAHAVTNTSTHVWTVTAATDTGAPGLCIGADTILDVYNATGTLVTSNDDDGSFCSRVFFTLDPGATMYLNVKEFGDDNIIPAYRLVVTTTGCGNAVVEPGEDCETYPLVRGCSTDCTFRPDYRLERSEAQACVPLTEVRVLSAPFGDDVWSDRLLLGSAFPFYAALSPEVRLASNGYLEFLDGSPPPANSPEFVNGPLDATASMLGVAAPYWDDLRGFAPYVGWVAGRGMVRTSTSSATLEPVHVFQWVGVSRFSDSDELNFQVVLHESSGNIEFNYCSIHGADPAQSAGGTATVGMKSRDGTQTYTPFNNTADTTPPGRRLLWVRY